jgi:ubiquinone/menaquinone biosynthesis C-methylase UbiE
MQAQNLTTGFQNVDNSQHQFLIKFLEDVSTYPPVAEGFDAQLKFLDIKPGDHILDVGCGIGIQALAMAKLTGPSGRVVGTDLSNMMIEIARARTAGSDLPHEFLIADAIAQPFADESFNCVRTERVLMYLKDPQAALIEFKRVLKPGGRVVVFDFDWDAVVIAHRDKTLTRRIVRYAADSFPNGRIGADLFRHLRNTGFKDLRMMPSAYGGNTAVTQSLTKRIYEGILQTGISNNIFTQTEIADWWKAFDEDASEGDLFVSFQGFITSGMKD